MTQYLTNTRREFLKTGTSLIGVSVLPYTFTTRRASARESKNDRLSFAAIGVGGVQLLDNSGIEIGEIIAFTQYLALVVTPLALMAVLVPFVLRGNASAGRIWEVIDEEPDVEDGDDAEEIDADEIKGRVALENVTFAFRRPDGELDPPALKDIDLTIDAGEFMAIMGPSGCGKTTIANLIARFYDATGGAVRIDGVDVRELDAGHFRRQIGMVLQDPYLFHGTVLDNIRYGKMDASDEEIIAAAKKANAHDFIMALPNGYDRYQAHR